VVDKPEDGCKQPSFDDALQQLMVKESLEAWTLVSGCSLRDMAVLPRHLALQDPSDHTEIPFMISRLIVAKRSTPLARQAHVAIQSLVFLLTADPVKLYSSQPFSVKPFSAVLYLPWLPAQQ
jgi:hypothetical protein